MIVLYVQIFFNCHGGIHAIKGGCACNSLMLKAYAYNGCIYDRYTKTIEMDEKGANLSIL